MTINFSYKVVLTNGNEKLFNPPKWPPVLNVRMGFLSIYLMCFLLLKYIISPKMDPIIPTVVNPIKRKFLRNSILNVL